MDTDTHTDITPQPEATGPALVAGTARRTKFEALLWMIFGNLGAYGGSALAIYMTIPVVEASNDDYAGLLFILTAPLGFIVGTIIAMLIARAAEKSSPSAEELFTRTQLAFMGVLLPIVLLFAGAGIVNAIVGY